MRILISTWSLQVGGGEVLAMNLAAELSRRGHEVFIFNQRAFLIDPDLVRRLLPAGVRVLSMNDKPLRSFWASKVNALQQRLGRATTYYDQQQQIYLAECLQRHRIELVSSHSSFSDRICSPVVAKLNIPFVITEHGEYSGYLLEDSGQNFTTLLRSAQRILTVSNYCNGMLREAFPDLPPLQTVYNGVVIKLNDGKQMRQQLAIPHNAFVFGMVARGVEMKGWKHAVLAFRQLQVEVPQRELRLVLVGGSTYLQELQNTCAADSNIIFTGQVPNPDFYVAGFDVGLLPSYFRSEALPLAVIEYIVSGKPSVATRVGGVPELLESQAGRTGLLVELDASTYTPNVKLLTAAMLRYCTDAELYAAHAHNCQQASGQFSMQTCAEQYEQAFGQVI